MGKSGFIRGLALCLAGVLAAGLLGGCKPEEQNADSGANTVELDPQNPVAVKLWHYYNGSQKNALDSLIEEFNKTVGKEKGIVVEALNRGNISELTQNIVDSAEGKVGSDPIPQIFAAYADTAYQIDKMGLVTNLEQYLTKAEMAEYISSYMEEGRIGADGVVKIFPTAKSTEVFMLNKTDWDLFAKATGTDIGKLDTLEGVTEVARTYYEWTDSQTPGTPDDGKAFFGRDAMANYFIIGCRQLGTEIFKVDKGKVTFQLDESIMRRLWDNYYIPYVNGWFAANGKFRSDDAKVGDIIALVGSSTTASYFPTSVVKNDKDTYPIDTVVLPAPCFEGAEPFAVQQGAGMVVTKTKPQEEYASVVFLKWFTEASRNLEFSIGSGYLPVKKDANTLDKLDAAMAKLDSKAITDNMKACLKVSMETVSRDKLYTNKAFDGGTDARAVLENSMSKKASADAAAVQKQVDAGTSRKQAAAAYNTDDHFKTWLDSLRTELENTVGGAS